MIIDDKMSSEKKDIIKEQAEDEMDRGISWAVLMVAFFGQAMSVGFYYCYGILYVEIVEAYGASDRQAGICFIIPLSKFIWKHSRHSNSTVSQKFQEQPSHLGNK